MTADQVIELSTKKEHGFDLNVPFTAKSYDEALKILNECPNSRFTFNVGGDDPSGFMNAFMKVSKALEEENKEEEDEMTSWR